MRGLELAGYREKKIFKEVEALYAKNLEMASRQMRRSTWQDQLPPTRGYGFPVIINPMATVFSKVVKNVIESVQ